MKRAVGSLRDGWREDMGANAEKKLNYGRTFLIGLAFMSICSFWQVYDNIIPLMLKNTFGLGETITGVVMALDNVLAIFLLPMFGTLSDKVDTRLGKRTPFIVVGTVLAVVFILRKHLPFDFATALLGAAVGLSLAGKLAPMKKITAHVREE